jgi:two-component system OmpR family response regulator
VDRPKVLVVDDEENIRFLVTSALSVQNLDVAAVDNGADALHHLRTANPVDVVVLDINLPDIDGFEILRRLRADAMGPARCCSSPPVEPPRTASGA